MKKTKLLVDGHDLKFLIHVINHFKAKNDYNVDVSTYSGHVIPDKERILMELPAYDIIFCEWGLGNLQWFSEHKLPWQKLITRIHSQEFATSYLSETHWENVNKVILVGEHMKEKFVRLFPDQHEKCLVIPNLIDTESYDLAKEKDASFNLGMLGILPKMKAPHLGLEILHELRKTDNRYKLYIKSKRPEELDWLWKKPEEREYYSKFYSSIDQMGLQDAVILEPHGADVQEWFRHIGFIISSSDHEAFHMAVAEGMASGAIPVIHNWIGANALYPERFVFSHVADAVSLIQSYADQEKHDAESVEVKKYCREHFRTDILLPEYDKLLVTDPDSRKLRKEYCKLQALKKKLEQEVLMPEHDHIQEDIKIQIEEHQDMLEEFSNLVNEVQNLKADLDLTQENNNNLKLSVKDLRTKLAAQQETNNNLTSLVQQLKNELVLNQETNKKLISGQKKLMNELSDFKQLSKMQLAEIEQLNINLDNTTKTNAKLTSDLQTQKRYLNESQRRLHVIHNSFSWKIGYSLIGKPAGLFRGLKMRKGKNV